VYVRVKSSVKSSIQGPVLCYISPIVSRLICLSRIAFFSFVDCIIAHRLITT